MKFNKQILTVIFLGIAVSLSAYDAVGHRIIADIAYQNLSKKAQNQVDKVLGKKGSTECSPPMLAEMGLAKKQCPTVYRGISKTNLIVAGVATIIIPCAMAYAAIRFIEQTE